MRRFLISIFLLASLLFGLTSAHSQETESVVFLIDTSGSMRGEKIDSVRVAVKEIAPILRKDIQVGVVQFNSIVQDIMPITLDRNSIVAAVDKIEAKGQTSLYDAISKTLDKYRENGPTRLIVLSDGEDTQSSLPLDVLINKATEKKIIIDIIGLKVNKKQAEILQNIANVTNGQFVLLSEISLLIDTYKTLLGDKIENQPISIPDPQLLNIVTNPTFELAIAMAFGFLALWLFLVIRRSVINRKLVLARLKAIQEYSSRRTSKAVNKLRIAVTNYAFIPDRIENFIRRRLEFINSKYSYEVVIRVLLLCWLVSIFLFSVIFQNFLIALLFAFMIPPFIFQTITRSVINKQRSAFADELPEMLNVVASGLRAGLSLQQGLEAYANDSIGEVARQIRRATAEVRVGTPIDEALMAIAERMESEDLKWVITTLSIQRVVGGSMSTILMTSYETIRSRAEIRREVKTLAAEGKLSAVVLMILPVGIFFFLLLTRRDYVQAFWTDPIGILMLIMVSLGMTIGWFWMKKIVEIKI